MKLYQAKSWVGEIEELEVIRETPHYYIYLDKKGKEQRMRKERHMHESWEAAHDYMLERLREAMERLEERLSEAQLKFKKAKGLMKP